MEVCTYSPKARSSASCYLYLAKPSLINDLDTVLCKEVLTEIYEFGFFTLHAQIKVMECLLHTAYRQVLKVWAVKADDDKNIMLQKLNIQVGFQKELGLLIDIVMQGSGTTNDGHTARRFFEFPEKTTAS